MAGFLPPEEQLKILMAGTEFGEPALRRRMEEELLERLREQRPLRVYLGVDPTAPDIHLGHTVPLRKLRDFQRLGHQVIFLIGSFTARIGDPSDRDRTRPTLTMAEIEHNFETYTKQAFKLLDRERTEIRHNAEWLAELNFAEVVGLAGNFTVQQFLQRDNFARRVEQGEPIYLHEFFYALMQGRDAVALQADVQVGGTDQTFNILAGRTLQQRDGQPPQILLTLPLIPGTDGVQKMSKSLGNAIEIDSTPEDMFGKIMSVPDEAMPIYIRQLTGHGPDEKEAWIRSVEDGSLHPRDAKMRLAWEITADFHGAEAAAAGQSHFRRVFQQGRLPDEMDDHAVVAALPLVTLMKEVGFARSNRDARTLITQNAVSIDGETIGDVEYVVEPDGVPRVLRVGKRRFLRLI